jgi:hypothetical protein
MKHNTPGNGITSNSITKVAPKEILQNYGIWFEEYQKFGWDIYFMTLMFDHISGSSAEKLREMQKETQRVYGKIASWVVRKPKSPEFSHFLPRGVFFPDVPCHKREKQDLKGVTVNDGIHFHGILAIPKNGRLKVPLDQHFRDKKRMYTRNSKLSRIHVQPINSDVPFVADYAGKAVKRKKFSSDDILILPRTLQELPQKVVETEDVGGVDRELKDIMSAHNVSEAVAQGMCQAKVRGQRSVRPR